MARTKKRALVTGTVPVGNALVFAALLGVAGFGLLIYKTNWLTTVIGIVAVVFYVVLYGIAKRTSEHGTLVGTVPGAASLVAGYTAAANRLDATAWLLFGIMVCWQMPHFYAIAIRRRKEYAAAGLPVLPVKRGVGATKRQMIGYVVAFGAMVCVFAVVSTAGYVFIVVMGGLSLLWLVRAFKGLTLGDDVRWAGQLFGYSLLVLTAFSLLLTLTPWLP
jgi:protoheme IX farnesyltransferase